MPDDLSLLDQLEEWLEAQVPNDLQGLPYRMLETMERVSNELFESLNMHGPPSISIPFPPFGHKEILPPPPPPPLSIYDKAGRLWKAHPYVFSSGAALALTVGLGIGGTVLGYGPVARARATRIGVRGMVQDGHLKEAIVLLSPSPMPPLLWPLAVTLLKAGYIVMIVVPRNEDAEQLEKRLAPLEERSSLRVLVYDPEDSATYPPFHRSLLATLSLRFPAIGAAARGSNDPYNPLPEQIPHIHAFISLYPLHPSPPNQPAALPALPALLAPGKNGKTPRLITIYPSTSVMVQPESFASQVLTANHQLLGRNLTATSDARIISLYVGDIDLPRLHSMIGGPTATSYKMTLREKMRLAQGSKKLYIIRDHLLSGLGSIYATLTGRLGLGLAATNYTHFERHILRAIKSRKGRDWYSGQYAFLPFILHKLPLVFLPRVLSILPTLPGATGPLSATVQGLPAPRKQFNLNNKRSDPQPKSVSASSSEHEGMSSSMHTQKSRSSERSVASVGTAGTDSDEGSVGSGNGLEGSWVGLEAGN